MTRNQLQALKEVLHQLQRIQDEFDLEDEEYQELVAAVPFVVIGGVDDFMLMMANLEDPSVVVTREPDEEDEDCGGEDWKNGG